MNRRSLAMLVALVSASATLAHQGVQNASINARMDGMSEIAENMKVLGTMTKGAIPFNADAARAAAAAITDHAAPIPTLFEANETDPKPEAKSINWDNFEEVSLKAAELEAIAVGLSSSISSFEDLRPTMGALGDRCKSCHSVYRK